jgi:hypothetical protein
LSGTRLELSPSWTFAGAILALHAAAAVGAMMVLPNLAGTLLGGGLLLLGLAAAWARALHGARNSVRALELSGSVIAVELRDGRRLETEVRRVRHVSRLLVTLPLRRPMRTVLVTRDMLTVEEFRRLRLWALWGKLPVAAKQLPARA